jgi:2-methylisocitrate lyase-like PEP mutase family enzyme
MARAEHPGRRLRNLLERDEVLLVPGAFDAMVALLVQDLGFETVGATGAGTALAMHGLPDLELLSMTEVARTASVFTECVDIPVIGDADTGYGNPLNVRRTIQAFEQAGVAGVHLEDQASPKRCGQLDGKVLISRDEMVQKLRAASEARGHPDFVLIARTDALATEDLDLTLDRCRAYIDAGADVIYVEAPRSKAEVALIAEKLSSRTHLLFCQSASGRTPFMSAAELGERGYSMMLFPNFATLTAIRAIDEVLGEIRRTGEAVGVRDRCVPLAEMQEMSGESEIERLSVLYGATSS